MVAQVIEPKTDPYATTTTSVSSSDGLLWSKPEKPKGKGKGKKARIRALEQRIAELEAIVAAIPKITYTSPGWPNIPPATHTWWGDTPTDPWKYLSKVTS